MAAWALITGATGGLGREFASQFAQKGYNLALVGRNYDALRELADSLVSTYGISEYICAKDLTHPGATEELASEIKAADIEIDTLVNNAGFGYDCEFIESDLSHQTALLEVNCLALMQLCYEFAIPMVERGHGNIINVASIAGFMPGPYMATYYASKAFVQSFSNALHVELAPHNIHVTTLCPGPINTAFWNNAQAANIGLAKATLCVEASFVVRKALSALGHNKMMCVPGALAKATVFASRIMPRELIAHMAAGLQKK